MNKEFKRSLLVFFVISFFSVPAVFGAPALFPDLLKPGHPPTCRVNGDAATKRAASLKSSPRFTAPISASTFSVIVIRVDFSDQIMTKTQIQTDAFLTSLKDFYLENSYGFMSVNATSTSGGSGGKGAYRMPNTLAFYANGLSSKYTEIATDAVALAVAAGVNFSSFDHVMIYHAGNGAETAPTLSDISANIWSAYAPPNVIGGPVANGKTFPGAMYVPESEFLSVEPLGVIAHEYGHQLGLPDLYHGQTGSTKLGFWSLMDSGVYLPNPASGGFAIGENPAHLDAWSKLFLGFSTPETISFSQGTTKTLSQASTSRTAFIRLPISVSPVGGDNEYFLLEYRRSGTSNGVAYDKFLPGQAGGLLIWHVDDSIALNQTRLDENTVNIGTPNLGLDLVESGDTDSSQGSGSSADPWPGSTVIFQSPKARTFSGVESGMIVSDIGSPGASTISATIKNTLVGPSTSDSVGVGGGENGYTNPSKGEVTRITIRPKSSGTIDLKIFSLNGDLVHEKSFSGTALTERLEVWDATNLDGNTVASGIYLIHVKGGGIDTKKKTAIIK